MKLTKITIIIACITIIIVCIALPRIDKVKSENAELRNYNTQLEIQLNIKSMQVKDLQDELTGANQEMEYYAIKYHGNALALYELEDRYGVTKSYANMAEFIISKMGIEFYQVD